jgi:predicted RNA polymerase sigma factor
MTEINQQPMSESLEEQKKKRPICEICKEDRSYQDWSDAVISFTNPAEHYHLGCLQIGVRGLRQRIKELEEKQTTSEPTKEDWPECEEFYNLMQNYRHMPVVEIPSVVRAYEDVKKWLRQEVQAILSGKAHQ